MKEDVTVPVDVPVFEDVELGVSLDVAVLVDVGVAETEPEGVIASEEEAEAVPVLVLDGVRLDEGVNVILGVFETEGVQVGVFEEV